MILCPLHAVKSREARTSTPTPKRLILDLQTQENLHHNALVTYCTTFKWRTEGKAMVGKTAARGSTMGWWTAVLQRAVARLAVQSFPLSEARVEVP
jgi:hypothetical protein